jgi:hypothetical protein
MTGRARAGQIGAILGIIGLLVGITAYLFT